MVTSFYIVFGMLTLLCHSCPWFFLCCSTEITVRCLFRNLMWRVDHASLYDTPSHSVIKTFPSSTLFLIPRGHLPLWETPNFWLGLYTIFVRVLNVHQIANICWIIEKAREFQKNIYFCFTDYSEAFDCVAHNKLWKILKEMGIPDHLTCLLRNLYAG